MTDTTNQVDMVTCTIDGQEIQVPKGTLLIEACRQLNIDVPFFCWHPHMSPFGACRQCLVQVEKMPKPVTSCTTQVTEGMVVHASTDEVKKWREGIVGFLLANHPLECPTCDKGGECDLQNISFKHGPPHSLFREHKRHFIDYDMGPIVVRDMDRCIQCQRCIRFGLEWSGDHGIEFFGRGASMQVSTFARGHYVSKFSGNVTEVCPVGALTSEPFRLKARPWEMKPVATICPHCAVGCNLTNWTRQNELLRITNRENVHVNVAWSCDKGKYGHHFVNSEDRIKTPMFRRGDRLVPASWQEALSAVFQALQGAKGTHGPEGVGFIGSQKASNEDVFMFQRLAREGVGTNNIDHRMGETFPAALVAGTGLALDEVAKAKTIVLFAADVREETPVVWLRIHNVQLDGARLIVIDERGSEADRFAEQHIRYRPGSEVAFLSALTDAVRRGAGENAEAATDGSGVSAERIAPLAEALKGGFAILAGPRIMEKPDSVEIVNALWALTEAVPGSKFGLLHRNSNSRGAYDMGATPDHGPGWQALTRPGMNTTQMLQAAADGKLQVLYLMGADPLANFPDAALAKRALERVPFLVVQDILRGDLLEHADVVLPALTNAEREGTFTNLEGRVQYFLKSVEPIGAGRPDWEICAALLQALGVAPGVGNVDDVTRQIAEAVPEYQKALPGSIPPVGVLLREERAQALAGTPAAPQAAAEGSAALPLILLTGDVLFDNGAMTRDTAAFQELQPGPWVDLSRTDAANAGIADGDLVTVSSEFDVVDLLARVGDQVQPGTAFVPNKVGVFRANTLTSVTRAVQRVRVAKKAVEASAPAPTTEA